MDNPKLINQTIGFIPKNPKENLSLQSIADNAGMKPVGLWIDNELVCLAMPSLDQVREWR